MTKRLSQSQETEMELLIDRNGLPELLSALSRICDEKADHIEASYSDASTA